MRGLLRSEAHTIVFCLSHIWSVALSSSQTKPTQGTYLIQLQNTIHFTMTFTTTPLKHNLTVPCLERYLVGNYLEVF